MKSCHAGSLPTAQARARTSSSICRLEYKPRRSDALLPDGRYFSAIEHKMAANCWSVMPYFGAPLFSNNCRSSGSSSRLSVTAEWGDVGMDEVQNSTSVGDFEASPP